MILFTVIDLVIGIWGIVIGIEWVTTLLVRIGICKGTAGINTVVCVWVWGIDGVTRS